MSGTEPQQSPEEVESVKESTYESKERPVEIGIVVNGGKLTSTKFSPQKTLRELRQKLASQLDNDDQFLNKHDFPILQRNEDEFQVSEIMDGNPPIVKLTRETKKLPKPDASPFEKTTGKLKGEYVQGTLTEEVDKSSEEFMQTFGKTPGTMDSPINAASLNEDQRKELVEWNNLLRGIRMDEGDDPKPSSYEALQWRDNETPKFDIFDKTTAESTTVYSKQVKNYVKHGFTQVAAEAAWKKFSITPKLEKEYTDATTTKDTEKYCINSAYLPKARVDIFKYAKASKSFENDIDEALKNKSNTKDELLKVFKTYGHVIAERVILGGRLNQTKTLRSSETVNEQKEREFVLAALGVKPADIGGGMKHEGDSSQREETLNVSNQMLLEACGGDTLLANNPKWISSVGDWKNWRTIVYEDVRPIYEILSDERKRNMIENILESRPTLVDKVKPGLSLACTSTTQITAAMNCDVNIVITLVNHHKLLELYEPSFYLYSGVDFLALPTVVGPGLSEVAAFRKRYCTACGTVGVFTYKVRKVSYTGVPVDESSSKKLAVMWSTPNNQNHHVNTFAIGFTDDSATEPLYNTMLYQCEPWFSRKLAADGALRIKNTLYEEPVEVSATMNTVHQAYLVIHFK